MRFRFGWWTAAAVMCGLRLASGQEVIEIQAVIQGEAQAEAQAEAGGGPKVKFFTHSAAVVNEPQFAIGVALDELPELLKSQLRLERGLVVSGVLEKSPAEKAGLKKNDIILSASGVDVKTPADLVAAVTKAELNPLSIVILRGGKEQKLEVKPDAKSTFRVQIPEGGDLAALARTFEKAVPPGGSPGAGGFFLQGDNLIRVHPGVMLGRLSVANLPAGMKLTISKEGDQPAKIIVEQGDQKWETTEDKLDALPEEVRGPVKKALSREARMEMAIEAPHAKFTKPAPMTAAAPVDKVQVEAIRRKLQEAAEQKADAVRKMVPPTEARVEAKLNEVLKKLTEIERGQTDKLQKQVEELREQVELLKKQQK